MYWLSLQGFGQVYPKVNSWAQRLLDMLDMRASIVIGFSKFQSYALLNHMQQQIPAIGSTRETKTAMRIASKIQHYQCPDDANADFLRISLSDTDLGVTLTKQDRIKLNLFKISTIGHLLSLPEDELKLNLSRNTYYLYKLITQQNELPAVPIKKRTEIHHHIDFECNFEPTAHGISAVALPYFTQVIEFLKLKFCRINQIDISIDRDLRPAHLSSERVSSETGNPPISRSKPLMRHVDQTRSVADSLYRVVLSEPTLDIGVIEELLRIKLSEVDDQQQEPVRDCSRVYFCIYYTEQRQVNSRLFKDHNTICGKLEPKHISAANQALDYLRNKYGDTSVLTAKTRDSYLPEDRFSWLPATHIKACILKEASQFAALKYDKTNQSQFVRRFSSNTTLEAKPVGDALGGPFRLSMSDLTQSEAPSLVADSAANLTANLTSNSLGGSICRSASRPMAGKVDKREFRSARHVRDYYYMRTATGSWKWIYFDHEKNQWRLQGTVE